MLACIFNINQRLLITWIFFFVFCLKGSLYLSSLPQSLHHENTLFITVNPKECSRNPVSSFGTHTCGGAAPPLWLVNKRFNRKRWGDKQLTQLLAGCAVGLLKNRQNYTQNGVIKNPSVVWDKSACDTFEENVCVGRKGIARPGAGLRPTNEASCTWNLTAGVQMQIHGFLSSLQMFKQDRKSVV